MNLIRILALEEMRRNVRINVNHVSSADNILADSLSRNQMSHFWANAPPFMEQEMTAVPNSLWPISQVWDK